MIFIVVTPKDLRKAPAIAENGYSGTWFTDGAKSRIEDGRVATVYRYERRNPYPELAIQKNTYVPAEDTETLPIINCISVITVK